MNAIHFLFAGLMISFAAATDFAQQRPGRKHPATPGMVQTVRIEKHQLRAVTYYQGGVMVSTNISDEHGRPLESADYLPGGNPDTKITSAYDQYGNEIEHAFYTHDELSRRSTTRYDSRNRKVEQLSFAGNGRQSEKFIFQYDKQGRQIAFEVQRSGKMVRRSVAVLNRHGKELERVEYRDNGTRQGRYVFRYDNAGRTISEIHYYTQDGKVRSSRHTYTYNRNGHLIEESLYFDGVLENRETYKRESRGNPLEVIKTDGKQRVVEKASFSHEYNQAGMPQRTILSEWTAKAPDVPLQPTFEYRHFYGSVSTATFALWSAAREGNAARVAELLKEGADVNAHHPDGGTPLIKAAPRGHREVVQALLAAGAKVDDKDAEGWTALMWSAEFGKLEIVDALLKAGANPNAQNEVGAVALMPATLNGHLEVLKLLIEKGADVNAKTKNGDTALSIAVAGKNDQAAELLRKAGAK